MKQALPRPLQTNASGAQVAEGSRLEAENQTLIEALLQAAPVEEPMGQDSDVDRDIAVGKCMLKLLKQDRLLLASCKVVHLDRS